MKKEQLYKKTLGVGTVLVGSTLLFSANDVSAAEETAPVMDASPVVEEQMSIDALVSQVVTDNTTMTDAIERADHYLEDIPYETEIIEKNHYTTDYEKVIQTGEMGQAEVITYQHEDGTTSKEEDILKHPINHIVEKGDGIPLEDKQVETTEIPFELIEEETDQLLIGDREIAVTGQNGLLETETIHYHLYNVDGKLEVIDTIVNETILEDVVNQVVRIGTAIPVWTEEVLHSENVSIPYETQEVLVDGYPTDYRYVKTPGKIGEGIRHTKQRVDQFGNVTGNPYTELEVNFKSVDEIVEIGSGLPIEEETIERIAIPYETRTQETEQLLKGDSYVWTEGSNGVLERTTLTSYMYDEEGNRVVADETITDHTLLAAVDEVLLVGVAEEIITEEEIDRVVHTVPYETIHALMMGYDSNYRVVVTEGVDGQTATVTKQKVNQFGDVKGEPYTEVIVLSEPVDEVVEVGDSVPLREEASSAMELPFEVIRKENPAKDKGYEAVIQEGQTGEKHSSTIIEYLFNVDGVREVVSKTIEENIIKHPVAKVIEFGTKEALLEEEDTKTPLPEDEPVEQPVVEWRDPRPSLPETGEAVSLLQGLAGLFTISGLGILFKRKR